MSPSEKAAPVIAVIEGTTIPLARMITGSHYKSTAEGFTRLIAEANIAAASGWTLITVVHLEHAIAVLYQRSHRASAAPTHFFEED